MLLAGSTVSQNTIRVDETPTSAVDLFCGFGGATSGLKAAGLRVELAVDLNRHALRHHEALHPDVPTLRADVSQVRPSQLAGRLVWASPSCKPWSFANTVGAAGADHPEYYPLTRLVDQAVLSHALIIENVPGLLQKAEGRVEMGRLDSHCRTLGKPYQVLKLNALDFGLNQSRERVFIVVGVAAPLVLDRGGLSQTPGGTSHPTVTTKTPDLRQSAQLQGLVNPLELSVREYRSSRRATGQGPKLRDVARHLIGNAVPPIMAERVARAVLRAFGSKP